MAHESWHSENDYSYEAVEINFGLSDILDDYLLPQDAFFDACRYYYEFPSSKSYEDMEDTAHILEFGLSETIKAIASRQQNDITKIRFVDGFILADDNMRVDLFRNLVPTVPFQAFSETRQAALFYQNIVPILQNIEVHELIANMTEAAVSHLRNDMVAFGEAVLVAESA
jgi:hypothetical protein